MGRDCLTLGDIADPVLEVVAAAGPGHVLEGEGLVGAQHDHLDGAALEQHDLVLCRQIPAENLNLWVVLGDRGDTGRVQEELPPPGCSPGAQLGLPPQKFPFFAPNLGSNRTRGSSRALQEL